MPRVALHLSKNVMDAVRGLTGVEDLSVFDDLSYAIIDAVSPTEFNFKLVTEDEIFEAVKSDSSIEILSM